MRKNEWRGFCREDRQSPLDILAVDVGQVSVIRTTALDVSGAAEHVQPQEHPTKGLLPVCAYFCPVDSNPESLQGLIMGDRYTTSAVEEQTFEDSKVGLPALVANIGSEAYFNMNDRPDCGLVPISARKEYISNVHGGYAARVSAYSSVHIEVG